MQLISVGVLSVGLLIATGTPAHAQARATGADLRGYVQDTSGGRLPGASVAARNRATNIVRTVVTEPDGRFVIAALDPGEYDLRAEHDGFSPSVREHLALQGEPAQPAPRQPRPRGKPATAGRKRAARPGRRAREVRRRGGR